MSSWKAEMHVDDEWASNSLRFETKEEAEIHARDLFSRWMAPDSWRVTQVDDPVTTKLVEDPETGRYVQLAVIIRDEINKEGV